MSGVTFSPRRLTGVLLAAAAMALPAAVRAQASETTLVPPTIPEGFDRGRNVSVLERPRPDYDPLGIRAGGFLVFPRVDLGLGATNNTYLTNDDKQGSVIAYVAPAVIARSDWSRHQVQLNASGQLRRFLGESRRNEDVLNLGALGRLDAGSFFSLTGEAQFSSQFETPFSGETVSEFVALSRYTRGFLSLRGQYQAGQARVVLAVDHTGFDFDDIELSDNQKRSQKDRDRDIERVTGQVEYAFTPSVAIYGQAAVSFTDYDRPLLNGLANRDSTGFRLIGGFTFDLAGLMRGTVGAGYVQRRYDSPIYDDVSGFSVEARLEYFPTELTTFSLGLRRVIEDSSLGATNAYFDNRLSLRVDHELLQNLLLNATAEFSRQDYIGVDLKTDVYRFGGGARYLVSRTWGLDGGLAYTGRSQKGSTQLLGTGFDEVRGQLGVYFRR